MGSYMFFVIPPVCVIPKATRNDFYLSIDVVGIHMTTFFAVLSKVDFPPGSFCVTEVIQLYTQTPKGNTHA